MQAIERGDNSCMMWMYLGAGMGHTNVTARVTLLCELAGEEFIEFGAEDTVCNKLAFFADLGSHLEVIGWAVGDDISPEPTSRLRKCNPAPRIALQACLSPKCPKHNTTNRAQALTLKKLTVVVVRSVEQQLFCW